MKERMIEESSYYDVGMHSRRTRRKAYAIHDFPSGCGPNS